LNIKISQEERIMKQKIFAVSLLSLVLILSACGPSGPTNADVIKKFQAPYASLRTDLAAAAKSLPDYNGDQGPASPLNPAPVYKEKADGTANTDILMVEQLLDPDARLDDKTQLDLLLSSYLLLDLQWTGPQNPMADSIQKQVASDPTGKGYQADLDNTRYIGVVRMAAYDPPVAGDNNQFTGGEALFAGYLLDLKTKQAVCVVAVDATSDTSVKFEYKTGDDPKAALERFVRSTVWSNARKGLIDAFTKTCGGTYTLKL
jgi:hypothetical protein